MAERLPTSCPHDNYRHGPSGSACGYCGHTDEPYEEGRYYGHLAWRNDPEVRALASVNVLLNALETAERFPDSAGAKDQVRAALSEALANRDGFVSVWRRVESVAGAEDTVRSPDEWAQLDGVLVLDPDGWRAAQRADGVEYAPQGWGVPITRAEWNVRSAASTCGRRIRG